MLVMEEQNGDGSYLSAFSVRTLFLRVFLRVLQMRKLNIRWTVDGVVVV